MLFVLLLVALGLAPFVLVVFAAAFLGTAPAASFLSEATLLFLVAVPGFLVVGYLSSRISLVLPATAVDQHVKLKDAWAMSIGNGWRLAIVTGVPLVFVGVLGTLLDRLKRFSNRPCTTWGGRGTSARTDAGGPMRAYSMDLRERALLDSDAGMKAADVAAKYRVSGSWVRLLKQRRRETGEVAPRVQRHGRRCMLEPHLHTLAALIAAHPDRTPAELKDALATPASVPTVWRAVRALGLTVKKNGPPVRTRSA